MARSLKVVQLSDTHLFGSREGKLLGCCTGESFKVVVDEVQAVRPDLVLFTGDLSQDGTEESYAHLRALAEPLGAPCYWLPGNHDDPAAMQSVLHEPPFSPDKVFQAGGWNFILLSSQVPGETFGTLPNPALNWLEERLQEAVGRPTVVALHHPPVPVGSAWLDDLCLRDPERLLAVIDAHPHIRIVMTGHVHQDLHHRRGTTDIYCTRSTCLQFKPNATDFALDVQQFPGFRVFSLRDDGTYATRLHHTAHAVEIDASASGY